jgi:hypothetical protein
MQTWWIARYSRNRKTQSGIETGANELGSHHGWLDGFGPDSATENAAATAAAATDMRGRGSQTPSPDAHIPNTVHSYGKPAPDVGADESRAEGALARTRVTPLKVQARSAGRLSAEN